MNTTPRRRGGGALVQVLCHNGCGNYAPGPSVNQALMNARRAGWRVDGRLATCPPCKNHAADQVTESAA